MHEHLDLPQPYTQADAERYVEQMAPQAAAEGSELILAIAENTSGRVLGSIALRGLAGDSVINEVGYWVATSDWGQGYATEAVRTVARFAVAQGARRIELLTEVGNLASAKVALRSGFRFEAVLRSRSPVVASSREDPRGSGDFALFARVAGDPDLAIQPVWPSPPQLTDGVIALRALEPGDAELLLAEHNNAESRRWSMFDDELTEAAAVARAARGGLDWLTGTAATLVISDAASSAPAGILTLRRGGPPDLVSVGYGVRPEFRGRRFTSRALHLVAEWLFANSTTERIELGCKAGNVASARAAEQGGFTPEGRSPSRLRNIDGSFSDELRFYRLR
jgi:RimJ/RimL family protein N-acetyltransferase